jgi:hypothetical protein
VNLRARPRSMTRDGPSNTTRSIKASSRREDRPGADDGPAGELADATLEGLVAYEHADQRLRTLAIGRSGHRSPGELHQRVVAPLGRGAGKMARRGGVAVLGAGGGPGCVLSGSCQAGSAPAPLATVGGRTPEDQSSARPQRRRPRAREARRARRQGRQPPRGDPGRDRTAPPGAGPVVPERHHDGVGDDRRDPATGPPARSTRRRATSPTNPARLVPSLCLRVEGRRRVLALCEGAVSGHGAQLSRSAATASLLVPALPQWQDPCRG